MSGKKVLAVEFSPLAKRHANSALMNLLQHLQEGVCLFDGQQRLVACNDRYAQIYNIPTELTKPGVTLVEILKQRIAVNSMPDIEGEAYIASRLKAVYDGVDKNEVLQLRDGRVLSVRHKPMVGGGWLTTHTDITEIYDLKKEIEHMAYHDQLTGLCNRRRIEECVDEAVNDLDRGSYLALMFLDLDRFKEINDQYGHAAGDKVLQVVSERLLQCFRENDIISRVGGDELAVLQMGITDPESLSAMARRMVKTVGEPILVSGKLMSVGASVGIIFSDDPSTNSSDLWLQADSAMYDAKNGGGANFITRRYRSDIRIAC